MGYHEFFCENLNTYDSEGESNIWICKNRNSSKGAGISITQNINEIIKKKGNYLVQKYI